MSRSGETELERAVWLAEVLEWKTSTADKEQVVGALSGRNKKC